MVRTCALLLWSVYILELLFMYSGGAVGHVHEHSANAAQPEDTWVPHACLTYEQRYKAANDTARLEAIAGKLSSTITRVVIVKLHIMPIYSQDLLLNLHALACEVMESSWHFFILLDGNTSMTRNEVLHSLPKSLRPFLVVYNHEDSERLYPRLAENYKARNQDFGPGQHYSYLGEIVFMQQYRSYEFMYCIEYDVRLVGHYGEFLDASMRHAEVTHGHNMQASLHHHGHHAGDTPSGMSLGPADLILYGHLGWGDKWSSTIISLNLTDHWDAFLMVYGASRRLVNAIHDMSLKGEAMYLEGMIPTAAMLYGLKAVALDGAHPHHDAYHCCHDEAKRLYLDFAASQTCTKFMLLHAIKEDAHVPLDAMHS